MQRHPCRIHINIPNRGLQSRKSGPGTIRLICTCDHLQDLQTGWKTESRLPDGGIIDYYRKETHRRFLTPGTVNRA